MVYPGQKIQEWLRDEGYGAFLIPMADPFQNEYVPPHYQYLQWVTGFTGSAGYAIVCPERAALFVDGRYKVQAPQQVNLAFFDVEPYTLAAMGAWIQKNYHGGDIAFDAWCQTPSQIQQLQKIFPKVSGSFQPLYQNPIESMWRDRPQLSPKAGYVFEEKYAGKAASVKLQGLADAMTKAGVQAHFIGDVTSLNWLLNMRGQDLPHTPVVLGYGLAHDDGTIDIYMPLEKAPHQALDQVRLHPLESVRDHIKSWSAAHPDRALLLPKGYTPYALYDALQQVGAPIVMGEDLCALPKAQKNATELDGFRQCHIWDGAALTSFLYTLANQSADFLQQQDEISLAQLLEMERQKNPAYKGPSFPTISAIGPHAALPHYQATEDTNVGVTIGDIYLVDSGGQYKEGTTDVTRTICLGGEPTEDQRRYYTLVLKGHIALTTAKFPEGTRGGQLDVLARQFLWQQGADFAHGTGHGVGHFLNVHEGPQSISSRPNATSLLPGMVLSNEPGYYREGAYGIRIENLEYVRPYPIQGAEMNILGFEALTLAPLEITLIDHTLLTASEKEWLQEYHGKVLRLLSPHLTPDVRAWVEAICRRCQAL